ncbi:MAG: sigma-70 family RNA polymerase sigma factor [Nitriliruptor sp.]|uniref:sigma-70 family RNA polymerase sigma factor n=1 Tax=Nitriliruptor sp. TaxID=2448056 RepID=UPI00349FE5CC
MRTTTARAPRATDAAADGIAQLIEAHVHLVDHVVHQLTANFPRHVDRDELLGAGAAGLVDAAHRYDPSTGVPFARYATIRIRGAVLDETRGRDWATRRLRRDLRAIERATSVLEERLQRVPHDTEIAGELGVTVELVRKRRASAVTSRLLTLDRPLGEDGEAGSLADRVTETDVAWLPGPALERSELVGTLRTAVAALPEGPRRVLIEHHFEGRLLRDIADSMGVTEARVSQLRHEALRALQAYFGTVYDGVPEVPTDAPGKRARTAYVEGAGAWPSPLAAPAVDDLRVSVPA